MTTLKDTKAYSTYMRLKIYKKYK